MSFYDEIKYRSIAGKAVKYGVVLFGGEAAFIEGIKRIIRIDPNKVEIAAGKSLIIIEGEGLTVGDIEINSGLYEVKKAGRLVELTLREFELLKFLAGQPGRTFTREQLLEKVWGYEYFGDVRTVDVTVRRLREKIEDNPAVPDRIMTRRGVGYYYNK